MSSTLYEADYYLWVEQTAQKLREGRFDDVDWYNLIEEIEDMGKSQKRALESLLTRLLEHLLKLSYWESEKDRSGNHWAAEIVNFRYLINKRIKESPSLKPGLESMYAEIFPIAVKSVSKLFSLPADAHISLEQTLDENWFPDH
ncbi:MAG: DUF29 domain-containing protein [Gomphosphaeria aponina SAG 52.96 = DSM 107014]|uniref:DUF29 domain-containing protein n=1 Tax=Gomphosphaeria aponina SAG 52.96 = DSM 107014 TaxID=1521640 RepID=A0A941GRS3_9CHRO|nr:DUF29 domain-containing protein [Gomphosphaeria aponina SAG 52.96 = DSM 107014]